MEHSNKYITLKSDGDVLNFPNNSPSNFTNCLYKPILNAQNEYEIALCELWMGSKNFLPTKASRCVYVCQEKMVLKTDLGVAKIKGSVQNYISNLNMHLKNNNLSIKFYLNQNNECTLDQFEANKILILPRELVLILRLPLECLFGTLKGNEPVYASVYSRLNEGHELRMQLATEPFEMQEFIDL